MCTNIHTTLKLDEALDELSSAEDFLSYFNIGFDPTVVHVNRLHIMQRFHDYLQQGQSLLQDTDHDAARVEIYTRLLTQAYQDFVHSDALTEKVFKVFKQQEAHSSFVPLDQLLGNSR